MKGAINMYNTQELVCDRKVMTVKEMGIKYGVSERTMSRILRGYGITKKADRTDIADTDLLNDYENGLTIEELRQKYHCSHDTVSKRLAKYGIVCSRSAGIVRHFAKKYNDLWPTIKCDLDAGMGVTRVRNKYHIRIDNLKTLMHDNGYGVDSANINERIARLKHELLASSDHRRMVQRKCFYLDKIAAYFDQYKLAPTRRELSDFMNVTYTNVCQAIKRYHLESFMRWNSRSYLLQRVIDWLNTYYVSYELNNRKILDGKELDIWIPDMNLGLEINPVGTHSVDCSLRDIAKTYHQDKALLAREKGIGLIHIYDNDNLDSIGKWLFHKPVHKIGARQCLIKAVDETEACRFLNEYHLLGYPGGKVQYDGLYYNDILVSLIGIGKNRYEKNTFELVRYATHYDYAVSGGFMRLFKYVCRSLSEGATVISYMDLDKRKSAISIYDKVGFTLLGATPPSYCWISDDGSKHLSRYQTQKSKLIAAGFDANLTEKEIMHHRHYKQVYGAGSLKFKYRV